MQGQHFGENMSTQHTPGPWEAVGKRPDKCCGYSIFSGNQLVAFVGDTDWETPVDANARLIAASPDLLDACQALIAYCDKNPPMGDSLWSVRQIRAAIAKATGEPCATP